MFTHAHTCKLKIRSEFAHRVGLFFGKGSDT